MKLFLIPVFNLFIARIEKSYYFFLFFLFTITSSNFHLKLNNIFLSKNIWFSGYTITSSIKANNYAYKSYN